MKGDSTIDLRSDTVTKPTRAMREAMASAEVGDDVFGEDPTVNKLQDRVAELLGKEAAIFVPTGVMANQIAIKVHTQPGDEVIVEAGSHIFNYETAASAFLSNVQLRTIEGEHGVLRVEQLAATIRPPAYYIPRTSLVCLENTHNRAGGTVYPIDEIKKIRSFTEERRIALHLDGARLWNASVATGISVHEYSRSFDTVSVCFSKGLGAPVGSALAGSKALIERARTYRKILGGGMRQAGIIAAGALFALDHHIARLKEDHEKARLFAQRVSAIRGLVVDLKSVQTNIVIIDITRTRRSADDLISFLGRHRVLLTDMGNTAIRAVTHMDVSAEQVEAAAETMKNALGG